MNKHIIFLRGINVSGKNLIKMKDLQAQLNVAGLNECQTYIQSGNLFLLFDGTANELEAKVKDVLTHNFKIDVPVLVLSHNYIKECIAKNPFSKKHPEGHKTMYYTLLHQSPEPQLIDELLNLNYEGEEISIGDRVVYFYSNTGYGKAKLNNNLIEKRLRVTATTRNHATMVKMASY